MTIMVLDVGSHWGKKVAAFHFFHLPQWALSLGALAWLCGSCIQIQSYLNRPHDRCRHSVVRARRRLSLRMSECVWFGMVVLSYSCAYYANIFIKFHSNLSHTEAFVISNCSDAHAALVPLINLSLPWKVPGGGSLT